MEDEAARPLRSSEQLEARMCELKRLVASELLSADDVAVEVAQLRAEARAWLLRTAAADVQPGGAAAPLPPPAPPALAPAPALAATTGSALARSALSPAASAATAAASAPKPADKAAAAREAVLRASKGAGKLTSAPVGCQGIMSFAGFTREVVIKGVLTAVLPVALNVGRFRCESAPACTFNTDFHNALAIHQRYCKHGAAAPHAAAAEGEAGDDEGDDSDDSRDERAAPVPAAKKQRGEPEREDGRKRNRGSKKRHTYTFGEKADILDVCAEQMEGGATAKTVAESFGISESLLSKWRKSEETIYSAAADDMRKALTKTALTRCAGTARYPAMESKLVADIKRLRARGRHLSIRWLVTRARAIFAAEYPDDEGVFLASRNWRRRFARRHKLTRLKVSNTKSTSVEERLPLVREFHQKLALLISSPPPSQPDAVLDPRWGRFLPTHRFNLDQVGLPFVGALGPTFEFIGTPKVQVKTQAEGLSKRQATIQLCFGPKPRGAVVNKIAIIFRGTGARIPIAEKRAYDSRVVVQFQPKAWMDREVATDWAERVWEPLKESLPGDSEALLFLDNLDAHRFDGFLRRLRRARSLARFLVPNCTDIIQPVDAGGGALFIMLYSEEQDKWLDIDAHLELWESAKLSAGQRRILMTQWVGAAWDVFNSPKYDNARRRYFEKTGCLMSADGSDDAYITPEGTAGYRFTRLDPTTAAAVDDDDTLDVPTEVAEPPDSESDEPIEDAAFDALLEVDALAYELGNDDPELAAAGLMSFGDMVKLAVARGDQLRMMSAMPSLDASLVGKRVAVRIVDIGWCAGEVVRRSSSSTVLSYNYAVRYDADDEQQHWLTEPRYVGSNVASAENDWSGMDAHPPGSWAVFTTSVLPRAPQAGRTTALRAAPPEIIALGGAEQRRRL